MFSETATRYIWHGGRSHHHPPLLILSTLKKETDLILFSYTCLSPFFSVLLLLLFPLVPVWLSVYLLSIRLALSLRGLFFILASFLHTHTHIAYKKKPITPRQWNDNKALGQNEKMKNARSWECCANRHPTNRWPSEKKREDEKKKNNSNFTTFKMWKRLNRVKSEHERREINYWKWRK